MKLIILGNSGLSEEVRSLAEELGHEVIARLTSESLHLALAIKHDGIIAAIGNPAIKKKVIKELEILIPKPKYISLISPFSYIAQGSIIGQGCVIQHGAIVMVNCVIEHHAYLNVNCTVGHGSIIGEYCTINPSANISGDCVISERVLVGTGAQVLEKLTVGEESFVGAGAVVTRNVPNNVIAKGIPARWK
jgi:sugar O-acyltransferase (sialic acid O-acetyltransferase NeuD family)